MTGGTLNSRLLAPEQIRWKSTLPVHSGAIAITGKQPQSIGTDASTMIGVA